jgi:hypothetical protein
VATFQVDKKLVAAELRILRDPIYGQERPHVLELVTRLQRAETPKDYFDLHFKLLSRLRARQQILGELKERAADIHRRIASLAKDRDANREELEREQRSLELTRHQQDVQSALRFALLSVGDGLAWRALNYDRTGITVLGEGNRVAWLADKDGFDGEVQVIADYWDQGVFALHNDTTTCIRHGDVTAIRPQGREVIEVKRGHKPGDSPQMRRLEAATTLLNTGRHDDGKGRLRAVVEVPTPYRTGLANLRGLFARARRTGYAASRVGQLQFVAAVDERIPPDPERNPHERQLQRLGWTDGATRTFKFTSAERRMRERRHSFPGAAPFSIFPLPPEDVTDLVLGYLDFYSLLNVDRLERYLIGRGLAAEITVGANAGERFMCVTRRIGSRALTVTVSAQIREQMLIELMTPASLVASVNATLDAAEAEPTLVEVERVARMDESGAWP